MSEVESWLSQINPKYAQYASKLEEAGFDDVECCECLCEPDLKEMGIPVGHARMIVRACNPSSTPNSTPMSPATPGAPHRAALLAAAKDVAKMNEEHANALMNEMSKLPANPTSEIAIGLAKAQQLAADSQMASAHNAAALDAAMGESRDKLRRSLQGTQAARNTVDGCRTGTQEVIKNMGGRGEPNADSALGKAKQMITDRVEGLIVALRDREKALHNKAQQWAETKSRQLECEIAQLTEVIAEQDEAISEGNTTLSMQDWEMSIAMEPTASRLDAAAKQSFPAQPCADTLLLLHLPEVMMETVCTWGSVPGLCFGENTHPTIAVSNENCVVTMTGSQGVYRAAICEPVSSNCSQEPVFWEFVLEHSRSFAVSVGVCKASCMARGNAANAALGETPDAWMYSLCDQKVSNMGQKKGYGTKDWAVGDKVGVCLKFDTTGGTLTFYKNGAVMDSGPKSVAFAGGMTDGPLCPVVEVLHPDDRIRIRPNEVPPI